MQPVYRDLGQQSNDIVGFVFSVVDWEKYLKILASETVPAVMVTLRNSCGQSLSFKVDKNEVSEKSVSML